VGSDACARLGGPRPKGVTKGERGKRRVGCGWEGGNRNREEGLDGKVGREARSLTYADVHAHAHARRGQEETKGKGRTNSPADACFLL
jgi:hypothetical protein